MTAAHRIAVYGAGTMGVGIATLATGRGLPVLLLDTGEDVLADAATQVTWRRRMAQMTGSLTRDVAPGELTTAVAGDAGPADLADRTAVVEAVTEDPALKGKVLAEAEKAAPYAILISNTSAVPIDEQAGALSEPERLLGVHFMNPPYLIPTAEVIRGPRTGDGVMERARGLLDALGIRQVEVGDGPGFVINRILQRAINEAARIVADGVATPEAVDEAFRGCLGHTMGPLETADLIGLDNVADTLRVLHDRTGDPGYEPCALLRELVGDGRLGRKSGHGFFAYDGAR